MAHTEQNILVYFTFYNHFLNILTYTKPFFKLNLNVHLLCFKEKNR